MEQRIPFQQRQGVPPVDLNALQEAVRVSVDAVVANLLVRSVYYKGLAVTKVSANEAHVGTGRFFTAGQAYRLDAALSLNLAPHLPAGANRKIVAIVASGAEVTTESDPRRFLTDATTRASVANTVATRVTRKVQIGIVEGAESLAPLPPTVAVDYALLALITLSSTGIVDVPVQEASQVAPNLQDAVAAITVLQAQQALQAGLIATLRTDLAAIARTVSGLAGQADIDRVEQALLIIREKLQIPDDASAWGYDSFATEDESDTTHGAYNARVAAGLHLPAPAPSSQIMTLLNPVDSRVKVGANGVMLPAWTETIRLEVANQKQKLSIATYPVVTRTQKKQTQSVAFKWWKTRHGGLAETIGKTQGMVRLLDPATDTWFEIDKLDTSVLSSFMLGLLDDADAAAARATLGAAAGVHDHAWSALTSGVPGTIAALAGGTAAADKVWFYTGSAAGAFMTVTTFARSILDDADGASVLTTIGAAAAGHGHVNAVPAGAAGFMSGADKSKLDGVEAGANAYTHPTGDGSRHVPANGTASAGKVLKASGAAGTYSWDWVAWSELTGVPPSIGSVAAVSPAADRLAYYDGASTAALTPLTVFGRSLIDDADAAAARITLGAAATSHAHADATTGAAGFLSTADKTKLDGIAANANAYVHPSGDGNRHVPATGTTNSGKVLKAGATAASEAWGDVAWAEVTSKPTIIQAIAGLTSAADRLPYLTGTGAGSAALAPLTAFARSLLDDPDEATARATLGIGSSLDVQVFTSSSTWTKPTGKPDDTPVLARGWGGGGSGARSSGTAQDRSGGGGGSFNWAWLRLGDLPATVAVTIAAGGAARTSNQSGQAGGDSTFGSFMTCHGAAGGTQTGTNSPGGGGGGVRGAASGATGGLGTGAAGDSMFGGATATSGNGASSHFGGGAGAGAENDRNGGNSEWGGAGGSARSGAGGVSKFGGNGGSSSSKDGVAPGGGGAGDSTTSGAGARGEIHVIVF